MRFRKYLGIFVFVLISIFLCNSVFADTVQVSSPTIYWRAYTTNGELTSQAFNSTTNLPRIILSYQTGEYRTLQGFTIDFDVQDTLQTRYKTLVTKARVTQTDAEDISGTDPHKSLDNPVSWLNAGTTVQTVHGNMCSTQWLDKYNLEYTCVVNLDDYQTITNAQVTLGWAPTNIIHSDPLAVLCGTDISPNCAGNVLLSRFSYELSGKDSPTDANVEKIYSEVQVTNQYLEEMNSREQQGIENISNQTPSDISDTENQKTSDLITALGSLVGAFTSIQPASDCNIQLDFPEYAGGAQIVNLCQYKEKAPLIPIIGSSVLLVIFGMKYFHVIIIKIYRVIRSFIDGTDDSEGED